MKPNITLLLIITLTLILSCETSINTPSNNANTVNKTPQEIAKCKEQWTKYIDSLDPAVITGGPEQARRAGYYACDHDPDMYPI